MRREPEFESSRVRDILSPWNQGNQKLCMTMHMNWGKGRGGKVPVILSS